MKPIPLLTFEGYDPGPRGGAVFGRSVEKSEKKKRKAGPATAKQKASRQRFKKAAEACRLEAKQAGVKAYRACIAEKLRK